MLAWFSLDKQVNGITIDLVQSALSLNEDEQLDEPDSPGLIVPTICLPSAQHLEVPSSKRHSQRRTSRDDSTIGLTSSALQSKLSTSTLFLFEPTNVTRKQSSLLTEPIELRRSVSTSRLSPKAPTNRDYRGSSSLRPEDDSVCDSISNQIKSRSYDQSDFKELATDKKISSSLCPLNTSKQIVKSEICIASK